MIQQNTLTKTHLPVAQNASGRNLNVPVYHVRGEEPGPTVYIQSSIHGAEVQGNVVIYHLLQQLKQLRVRGEIILVPNCNPVGTNIKAGEYTLGRFDPVNGTNWNRGYHYDEQAVRAFADTVAADSDTASVKTAFRQRLADGIRRKLDNPWGLGLAQQLNLRLQQMAVNADIVLDLHNGPVSTRHIYIPEYARGAAHDFNMPHCIFIPNVFAGALDEACFCPWWTLSDCLHTRHGVKHEFGIEGFTLEMGSQEVIQFEDGLVDALGILGYLNTRGVLRGCDITPQPMRRVGVSLNDYKTLYTDWGGMVEYLARPGEPVAEGSPMANILNIDELDNERGHQQLLAPCDLIPILHFPSASVLSGTQLYKVFTNYHMLSE